MTADTGQASGAPFAIIDGQVFQGPQDLCFAYRQLKAAHALVGGCKVLAWRFNQDGRTTTWRDGIPAASDHDLSERVGCAIEYAYAGASA